MVVKDSGVFFVEIYVGMAKIVAWWHQFALGFKLKGTREFKGLFGNQITYWLQNGNANILLTAALDPSAHDIVSFVDSHGNSIKRFAVEVEDINDTLDFLRTKNAIFLHNGIESVTENDEKAELIRCKLFDDNEIVFVKRTNCTSILPGFQITNDEDLNNGILGIDHLASVVRFNESSFWNDYISSLLSLDQTQTIGEEFFENHSIGMKMHVLNCRKTKINKVISEPLPQKEKKSQVDVFLDHHFGNGIQHLAFEVEDLIKLVSVFKSKGIAFTAVPEKYYDSLTVDHPDVPVELLRKYNILCEQDGDKLLLQVFTEPIGDRPTLFYEFIQRINKFDGFGANNIKQLFKSLENTLNGSN